MIAPAYLACAFFVDLVIGDPRWLPHPVQIIGKAIEAAEKGLRGLCGPAHEKAAGALLVCVVVVPAAAVAFVIARLLLSFSTRPLVAIGALLFIYLASTSLALRSLLAAAKGVIDATKEKDLSAARQRLSMIVGRDTQELEEEAILRATIETVAENLSDGFVAPRSILRGAVCRWPSLIKQSTPSIPWWVTRTSGISGSAGQRHASTTRQTISLPG